MKADIARKAASGSSVAQLGGESERVQEADEEISDASYSDDPSDELKLEENDDSDVLPDLEYNDGHA